MEQILYFKDKLLYRGYDNEKRHTMSQTISRVLYELGLKESMKAHIENNVYKLVIDVKDDN